jgi:hypothetical protein
MGLNIVNFSKRAKWGLMAVVFLFSQFIPLINISEQAKAETLLDSSYKIPTSNNNPNDWKENNIANVNASDDKYISDNAGKNQGLRNFNFSIPANSIIKGVELLIEGSSTNNVSLSCRIGVALSWNNGLNFTNYKYSKLNNIDTNYILGGQNDKWEHDWQYNDFSNDNFVIKIEDNDPGTNCEKDATTNVDLLQAKVYYTEPIATQSITVKKFIKDNNNKSTPAGASWKFNIAGQDVITDSTGTTTAVEVPVGSYSVTEASPIAVTTDYSVVTAVCKNQTGNTVGALSGYTVSEVAVTSNDKIICEFVNDLAPKVDICHADSATTKPYVQNNPNKSGDVSGHDGHDGGIWFKGATVWGDIIPPFQGEGYAYPGQNWTPEGISIWNNDCNITPPKPTLQLVKETVGSSNPEAWTLTATDANSIKVINQTGTLQPNGTATTPAKELPAGTYALSESGPNGFNASEWNCTAGLYDELTNSVTLTAGQNAVCTITNTKKATIYVEKYNDTNNDGIAPNYQDANQEPRATVPFEFTLYKDNIKLISASSDTNGYLNFGDFEPGAYTVCESLKDGWANTYAYPEMASDPENLNRKCVTKNIVAGQSWTFVFANYQQPKPATVIATKIVCSKESELPNWGNGGPNINSSTATDWVNNHKSCQFAQDWDFQWSFDNIGNPGDNVEYGNQGWNTFGPTKADGTVSLEFNNANNKKIWFREALKPGYLTFSYSKSNNNSNDKSAEFYCHNDVLNYDNWEWIANMEAGFTYYCVAWNVADTYDINGFKWHDTNKNGQQDDYEKLLGGWTIFIDSNKNGLLDDGEKSTTTSASQDTLGWYSFTGMPAGIYSVCEVQQTGWSQTYPANNACHAVELPADNPYNFAIVANNVSTTPIYNFGNYQIKDPKLTIHKQALGEDEFEFDIKKSCTCYEDFDYSESRLACQCDKKQKETVYVQAGGSKDVPNVKEGIYSISEDVPEGWVLTDIYCQSGNEFFYPEDEDDDDISLYLQNDKQYDCYFTNEPVDLGSGTVKITKYHDKNQNGTRDNYFNQNAEPALPNIDFALISDMLTEPLYATTDQNGVAVFNNVPNGYYLIQELLPEDSHYQVKEKSCTTQDYVFDEQDNFELNQSEYDFYLASDDLVECSVGNISTKHYFNLDKTNDAITAKKVGDIITFTLTLNVPDDSGVLYGPQVADAPPTGFKYIKGSWTASSNLRGNLVPGVSVEPNYASPGVWNFNGFDSFFDQESTLPNNALYPGEVITLSYKATIDSAVSAGNYPDIALSRAYNTSVKANQTRVNAIFANVQQEGDSPFVRTKVTVQADVKDSEVLLVNTGTGAWMAIMLGSALMFSALATRRLSISQRRLK